jgi:hypothetical protein
VALGPVLERGRPLAGFMGDEPAYQHALRIKRQHGLYGLVFGRPSLQAWLARCTATAPIGWFDDAALGPARRSQAALTALERGLVRAWRQAERRAGMRALAPVPLHAANAGLPQQAATGTSTYAWRVEIDVARGVNDSILAAVREVIAQGLAEPTLLEDINAVLLQHGARLADIGAQVQALLDDPARLARDELKLPLPRLHGLPHLFSPLLAEQALRTAALPAGTDAQLGLFDQRAWVPNTAVTIRPPALNPGETSFAWNLRAWWERHLASQRWRGVHLYLLRNPAAGGLRLYRDNGFAPDFMLWLKCGAAQVLALIDPKGFGRAWPLDKLALMADLEASTLSLPLRAAMLSVTLPADMPLPAGQAGDTDALWSARVLLQSDPGHIDRLMNHLLAALPPAPPP